MTDPAYSNRLGFLPLRDHRERGKVPLDERDAVYGLRSEGNSEETGLPELDDFGDWNHMLFWPAIGQKRGPGGRVKNQLTTSGAPVQNRASGSASATGVARGLRGKGGGAGGPGNQGQRPIGEWAGAVPTLLGAYRELSVDYAGGIPDARFETKFASALALQNAVWPANPEENEPIGTPGIVLACSREDEQKLGWYPIMGNRIIAHHVGKSPSAYSTTVYDINNAGRPHSELNAQLSSAVRVKGGTAAEDNILALNFDRSGGGPGTVGFGAFCAQPEGGGGASATGSGAGGQAIGFLSYQAGGPITPGAGMVDKHFFQANVYGEPVTSGHISTSAYYFADARRDCPLEFDVEDYKDARKYKKWVEVYLRYDPSKKHVFNGEPREGMWRWQTTVPFKSPGTGDPPGKPPGKPVGQLIRGGGKKKDAEGFSGGGSGGSGGSGTRVIQSGSGKKIGPSTETVRPDPPGTQESPKAPGEPYVIPTEPIGYNIKVTNDPLGYVIAVTNPPNSGAALEHKQIKAAEEQGRDPDGAKDLRGGKDGGGRPKKGGGPAGDGGGGDAGAPKGQNQRQGRRRRNFDTRLSRTPHGMVYRNGGRSARVGILGITHRDTFNAQGQYGKAGIVNPGQTAGAIIGGKGNGTFNVSLGQVSAGAQFGSASSANVGLGKASAGAVIEPAPRRKRGRRREPEEKEGKGRRRSSKDAVRNAAAKRLSKTTNRGSGWTKTGPRNATALEFYNELGAPAMSFKPARTYRGRGSRDALYDPEPTDEALATLEALPTVARIEALGIDGPAGMTNRPGQSRYAGGSGGGSIAIMPPELGAENLRCSNATSYGSRTVTKPELSLLCASIGLGPCWDVETGKSSNGWNISENSGELDVYRTGSNTGLIDLDAPTLPPPAPGVTPNAPYTGVFTIKIGGATVDVPYY